MTCCEKWKILVEDITQIHIEKDGHIDQVYFGDPQNVDHMYHFIYCPYCRSKLQ